MNKYGFLKILYFQVVPELPKTRVDSTKEGAKNSTDKYKIKKTIV